MEYIEKYEYRVVEENDRFYPQCRPKAFRWWPKAILGREVKCEWSPMKEADHEYGGTYTVNYGSLQQAVDYIRREKEYNRVQVQGPRVVWLDD